MTDEERAAFRLTEDVLPDLPKGSAGWRRNGLDGNVYYAKVPLGLFSTRELALRALRNFAEEDAAIRLAEIDRAIAAEVANPTKEPR